MYNLKTNANEITLNNSVVKNLYIMDGIAIFLIVLHHTLGGINRLDAIFLTKYLGIFGLVLLTYSSGFKLGFNHCNELENKIFLKKYFKKRFIRLYKPYIGYSMLTSVPLFFVAYISKYYFKWESAGVNSFWEYINNLSVKTIFNFITGNNFVAPQLWYLIALIVITAICFIILYYFTTRTLYQFSIILMLVDILFWNFLIECSSLLFNIMVYIVIYIFGIFCACNKTYISHKKMEFLSVLFICLFLLSIGNPNFQLFKYNILIYGLTLPCFIILLSSFTLNKHIDNLLMICGNYSFQIYLFHWPLILPILKRLTIDTDIINYIITPYIIAVITIIVCVGTYNIVKTLKLNIVFE